MGRKFFFILLVSCLMTSVHAKGVREDITVDLPILSLMKNDDLDSYLAKELLVRMVYNKISQDKKKGSTLDISEEGCGTFSYKGDQKDFWVFTEAFCLEADNFFLEGISSDQLDLGKDEYLLALEEQGVIVYEQRIRELSLKDVDQCKGVIQDVIDRFMQTSKKPKLFHLERKKKPLKNLSLNEEGYTFFQLRLTSEDCQNIEELIYEISHFNYKKFWALDKKIKEIKEIGDKVNVVHPLRFIGYILSEDELKRNMKVIWKDLFIWPDFLEGLGERMTEEAKFNNLHMYEQEFCNLLDLDVNIISECIRKRDWKGFMKHAINRTLYNK